MTENRVELTTPAPGTPVSPTGSPVLGQNVVKIVAAIVGVAAALAPALPAHTIAFKVCVGIVGIGSFFGIVSQGVRT